MSNIPGVSPNAPPSVFSNTTSIGNGVSVPINNSRISCIMGLGARSQVLVSSATGDGYDGLNPTYTGISGQDGRHFSLLLSPIISNRLQLFRNGVLLIGLEEQIDNNAFSNSFDYRVDIALGNIELQRAHIVDQGGTDYTLGVNNVGTGSLQNLALVDINAPNESWTIKCITVQRDGSNNPIADTAKFSAFGSVSGQILDANGNAILWIADNQVTSNGILSFSILETFTPFREGDSFNIKIASGVLSRNDSLTATYIPVADINDPTFFTSMADITAKHGSVSLDNTLSLGCFLAFANSTPGIMAIETAPSLPRRTSLELESNFRALSTNYNDFVIPFPVGVSPDDNSDIHVFVTSPVTGIEKQLLPNKFPFFTLGSGGSNPSVSTFVMDAVNPPGGNSFSYSVVQENESVNFGFDGYINRDLSTQINAIFSSPSIVFDSSYIGKSVNIIDATNLTNVGSFPIVAVSGGDLSIRAEGTPPFSNFVNDSSVSFNLVDSVTGLLVPSTSGTDGSFTAIGGPPGTATATFHSTAINFNTFSPVPNGYKLQVTVSSPTATNIGLFDITAYSSGPNLLTIAKSFISEHNLKFEVIDSTQTSDYLVLNKKIVPNGYALRITYIDSRDAPFYDAGWETALATMETQEIDILVPLPKQTISVIFENAMNHCLEMSNILNKKERVLFIGAINGLTPDNITGAKFAAVEDIGILEGIQGNTTAEILAAGNDEDLANYSVSNAYGETYRAVYFYPDQIVAQVGTSNQIIDGFYQAAAAAGKLSGIANVAVPLTNKIISGFTILKNRQFSPTVIQTIVNAGATLLQPVAGGGRVVWGITTSQSGFPEEQEISIVFIRDRISKSFRLGFQGFIGNPEDPDTTGTITARATSMLNSFVSQSLITQFASLSVTRDLVDPRQWNVSCLVQPVYPVNWIYINVGVGVINSGT